MDKVLEKIRNMSPEEFQKAMEESSKGEICKAMLELAEFSDYLFEQEKLKCKHG